ncbi:MBL fold metallo-hydrolase [Pseudosulfitobacter sp. DSM 107133]|uniref:MBL fold metallo-hydrolase n=1 Tax=Pseudosulfitobacter sp. DSM 107133 TaxID=2883100 RepID=UPI000DF2BC8E|nr:MBL fold metallo-hydrolase [Pseudosulfitobacter sp. DSM 107133]UOA28223.1 putative metallo-hydrolase YflN [Pseudosulfitobacter sp. DSM 107133]
MTKTYIEPIAMLPFGMLNAFLLVQDQKAVLVDTGLPKAANHVAKALKKHGLNWAHIKLIVLTHGHIDHAGSAVSLRALTGAPVLAHAGDLPYFEGKAPVLHPTGMFGRLFFKTGAIQQPFDYFTPDHVMTDDALDLAPFGFDARILRTPGHTPGSVSVLLNDRRVIAGDLAASGILLGGIALRSCPKQPPFEEAPKTVAASLERLVSLGYEQFYLGHGGPLASSMIEKHIRFLRRLPAQPSGAS